MGAQDAEIVRDDTAEEPVAGIAVDDVSRLTAEERWAAIFSAITAFYFFDAIVGFVIALLGALATGIMYAVNSSSCSIPLWIPSAIVCAGRGAELCPGCAVLCSARAPNRRAFGIYVRRNLVLNIIQVVLGIVQFAVSLGALNKDCSDETVYTGMAVGIILAIESGIEIVVWVGCYGLYWYAADNQPPEWIDEYMPTQFKEFLSKDRGKADAVAV
mmetsp:Transcript_6595/g.7989  ORF Transcript_6595/g.7989 Transcript_6595/m.7989 type:complete len:215 (-) Transcript_6595:795-1439(-)